MNRSDRIMTIGDHLRGMRTGLFNFFSDPYHCVAVGIVLFGVCLSSIGFYDTLMYFVSFFELIVRLSWGYVYPLLFLITWPTWVSWWSIASWSIIVLVSSILVQIVGSWFVGHYADVFFLQTKPFIAEISSHLGQRFVRGWGMTFVITTFMPSLFEVIFIPAPERQVSLYHPYLDGVGGGVANGTLPAADNSNSSSSGSSRSGVMAYHPDPSGAYPSLWSSSASSFVNASASYLTFFVAMLLGLALKLRIFSPGPTVRGLLIFLNLFMAGFVYVYAALHKRGVHFLPALVYSSLLSTGGPLILGIAFVWGVPWLAGLCQPLSIFFAELTCGSCIPAACAFLKRNFQGSMSPRTVQALNEPKRIVAGIALAFQIVMHLCIAAFVSMWCVAAGETYAQAMIDYEIAASPPLIGGLPSLLSLGFLGSLRKYDWWHGAINLTFPFLLTSLFDVALLCFLLIVMAAIWRQCSIALNAFLLATVDWFDFKGASPIIAKRRMRESVRLYNREQNAERLQRLNAASAVAAGGGGVGGSTPAAAASTSASPFLPFGERGALADTGLNPNALDFGDADAAAGDDDDDDDDDDIDEFAANGVSPRLRDFIEWWKALLEVTADPVTEVQETIQAAIDGTANAENLEEKVMTSLLSPLEPVDALMKYLNDTLKESDRPLPFAKLLQLLQTTHSASASSLLAATGEDPTKALWRRILYFQSRIKTRSVASSSSTAGGSAGSNEAADGRGSAGKRANSASSASSPASVGRSGVSVAPLKLVLQALHPPPRSFASIFFERIRNPIKFVTELFSRNVRDLLRSLDRTRSTADLLLFEVGPLVIPGGATHAILRADTRLESAGLEKMTKILRAVAMRSQRVLRDFFRLAGVKKWTDVPRFLVSLPSLLAADSPTGRKLTGFLSELMAALQMGIRRSGLRDFRFVLKLDRAPVTEAAAGAAAAAQSSAKGGGVGGGAAGANGAARHASSYRRWIEEVIMGEIEMPLFEIVNYKLHIPDESPLRALLGESSVAGGSGASSSSLLTGFQGLVDDILKNGDGVMGMEALRRQVIRMRTVEAPSTPNEKTHMVAFLQQVASYEMLAQNLRDYLIVVNNQFREDEERKRAAEAAASGATPEAAEAAEDEEDVSPASSRPQSQGESGSGTGHGTATSSGAGSVSPTSAAAAAKAATRQYLEECTAKARRQQQPVIEEGEVFVDPEVVENLRLVEGGSSSAGSSAAERRSSSDTREYALLKLALLTIVRMRSVAQKVLKKIRLEERRLAQEGLESSLHLSNLNRLLASFEKTLKMCYSSLYGVVYMAVFDMLRRHSQGGVLAVENLWESWRASSAASGEEEEGGGANNSSSSSPTTPRRAATADEDEDFDDNGSSSSSSAAAAAASSSGINEGILFSMGIVHLALQFLTTSDWGDSAEDREREEELRRQLREAENRRRDDEEYARQAEEAAEQNHLRAMQAANNRTLSILKGTVAAAVSRPWGGADGGGGGLSSVHAAVSGALSNLRPPSMRPAPSSSSSSAATDASSSSAAAAAASSVDDLQFEHLFEPGTRTLNREKIGPDAKKFIMALKNLANVQNDPKRPGADVLYENLAYNVMVNKDARKLVEILPEELAALAARKVQSESLSTSEAEAAAKEEIVKKKMGVVRNLIACINQKDETNVLAFIAHLLPSDAGVGGGGSNSSSSNSSSSSTAGSSSESTILQTYLRKADPVAAKLPMLPWFVNYGCMEQPPPADWVDEVPSGQSMAELINLKGRRLLASKARVAKDAIMLFARRVVEIADAAYGMTPSYPTFSSSNSSSSSSSSSSASKQGSVSPFSAGSGAFGVCNLTSPALRKQFAEDVESAIVFAEDETQGGGGKTTLAAPCPISVLDRDKVIPYPLREDSPAADAVMTRGLTPRQQMRGGTLVWNVSCPLMSAASPALIEEAVGDGERIALALAEYMKLKEASIRSHLGNSAEEEEDAAVAAAAAGTASAAADEATSSRGLDMTNLRLHFDQKKKEGEEGEGGSSMAAGGGRKKGEEAEVAPLNRDESLWVVVKDILGPPPTRETSLPEFSLTGAITPGSSIEAISSKAPLMVDNTVPTLWHHRLNFNGSPYTVEDRALLARACDISAAFERLQAIEQEYEPIIALGRKYDTGAPTGTGLPGQVARPIAYFPIDPTVPYASSLSSLLPSALSAAEKQSLERVYSAVLVPDVGLRTETACELGVTMKTGASNSNAASASSMAAASRNQGKASKPLQGSKDSNAASSSSSPKEEPVDEDQTYHKLMMAEKYALRVTHLPVKCLPEDVKSLLLPVGGGGGMGGDSSSSGGGGDASSSASSAPSRNSLSHAVKAAQVAPTHFDAMCSNAFLACATLASGHLTQAKTLGDAFSLPVHHVAAWIFNVRLSAWRVLHAQASRTAYNATYMACAAALQLECLATPIVPDEDEGTVSSASANSSSNSSSSSTASSVDARFAINYPLFQSSLEAAAKTVDSADAAAASNSSSPSSSSVAMKDPLEIATKISNMVMTDLRYAKYALVALEKALRGQAPKEKGEVAVVRGGDIHRSTSMLLPPKQQAAAPTNFISCAVKSIPRISHQNTAPSISLPQTRDELAAPIARALAQHPTLRPALDNLKHTVYIDGTPVPVWTTAANWRKPEEAAAWLDQRNRIRPIIEKAKTRADALSKIIPEEKKRRKKE